MASSFRSPRDRDVVDQDREEFALRHDLHGVATPVLAGQVVGVAGRIIQRDMRVDADHASTPRHDDVAQVEHLFRQ